MKNNYRLLSFLVAAVLFQGCSMDKKTESTTASVPEEEAVEIVEEAELDVMALDGDDAGQAQVIADYLVGSLISDELEYLLPEQRTFQYAQVDLNGDGSLEYLVEFRNSYFCGTGGCTYILMTAAGEMITEFTVSDSPFYVSANKSNGWHDLVIPQGGVHNLMVFDGAAYPSNPSVEPEVNLADIDVIGELIQRQDGDEFTF